MAHEIASDPKRRREALEDFDARAYTAGATQGRKSKESTWDGIAKCSGIHPLDLNPDEFRSIVASLDAGGYRSAVAMAYQAKQKVLSERPGKWNESFDLAFKSAKRSA